MLVSSIIIAIFIFGVNANDVDNKNLTIAYSRPQNSSVHQCSSFSRNKDRPSDGGWSHPLLGDFHRNELYCDNNCDRNFCCSPDKLEDFPVNFLLRNNKVENRVLKYGDKNAFSLLTSGKVVFIVHGYQNNYKREKVFNDTWDGWVRRGANSILVDWRKNNKYYFQAIANVRVVGALIGQLVEYLQVAERTVCVGYSLGAHACGEAGTWLKKRGKTLPICHGLDPASPGYDNCPEEIKLDKADCGVVTVIHTSDWPGTVDKTGHCDFWLNNGHFQPGCQHKFSPICSHIRSVTYYNNELWGRCGYKGFSSTNCGQQRDCTVFEGQGMDMSPNDTCTALDDRDYFVKGGEATLNYCPG